MKTIMKCVCLIMLTGMIFLNINESYAAGNKSLASNGTEFCCKPTELGSCAASDCPIRKTKEEQ